MLASVVLATYNERENIVSLIEAIGKNLSGISHEVIVVDDSSPDGTFALVQESFRDRHIRAIKRVGERGLATAIRRGIEESKGDVIVLMDTDFSHSPEQVLQLVELARTHGASNGSRFVKGGKFIAQAYRQFGTWLIQQIARYVLFVPVTDFTNGFVAVRRDALSKIDYGRVFSGYGDYCIRLFYYLHRNKVAIAEIPSIYRPRAAGKSKTNEFSTALSYVLKIFRLRLGL